MDEQTIWEVVRADDEYWDDGISISFNLPYQLEERAAINFLKKNLHTEERKWLKWNNGKWRINLDIFREAFMDGLAACINPPEPEHGPEEIFLDTLIDTKLSLDVLQGSIDVAPKYLHENERLVSQTSIRFIITYEDIMANTAQKIFLSHKSADKALVREFKNMLRVLGFDPWLDEDQLSAGDKLHRGILQGFKDSCAVIFFITSNFSDENFLATEIDYAITEATEKGNKFRIITLVMGDNSNNVKVPDLLQQYVYKQPKTQLEALQEILKALPVAVQHPVLKSDL